MAEPRGSSPPRSSLAKHTSCGAVSAPTMSSAHRSRAPAPTGRTSPPPIHSCSDCGGLPPIGHRLSELGAPVGSRSHVREGVRAWGRWSNGGVEQHVNAVAADRLMASEEAFALVAGGLSGPFGGRVPGLDIQLDVLDLGHGPGKGRERSKCLTRQATPAAPGRDAVAHGGAALTDGSEPEAGPSNGLIGRGERDA